MHTTVPCYVCSTEIVPRRPNRPFVVNRVKVGYICPSCVADLEAEAGR